MSDNSPTRRSGSTTGSNAHTRITFRRGKANLVGSCLRKAFDDSNVPDVEDESFGKLLEMLN